MTDKRITVSESTVKLMDDIIEKMQPTLSFKLTRKKLLEFTMFWLRVSLGIAAFKGKQRR